MMNLNVNTVHHFVKWVRDVSEVARQIQKIKTNAGHYKTGQSMVFVSQNDAHAHGSPSLWRSEIWPI